MCIRDRAYIVKMASGTFTNLTPDEVGGVFNNMLANPGEMTFWMIVTVVVSFGVCSMVLLNGVERINKAMMSLLFVILIALCIRSVTLEGAGEGLKFYLVPDFGKMAENGIGEAVYAAMGQSFFTLSLGIGAMAIFGSYISKERRLTGECINICVLEMCIRDSTRGSRSSHFPKITFCWFPPERLVVISSGPIHLVCMTLISFVVAFVIFVSERAGPVLYLSLIHISPQQKLADVSLCNFFIRQIDTSFLLELYLIHAFPCKERQAEPGHGSRLPFLIVVNGSGNLRVHNCFQPFVRAVDSEKGRKRRLCIVQLSVRVKGAQRHVIIICQNQLNLTVIPVSYTHLDVYKRQSQQTVGYHIQEYRTLAALYQRELTAVSVNYCQRIVTIYTLRVKLALRYACAHTRQLSVAHGLSAGLAAHSVRVVIDIEDQRESSLSSVLPQSAVLIHGCKGKSLPYRSASHGAVAQVRYHYALFVVAFLEQGSAGAVSYTHLLRPGRSPASRTSAAPPSRPPR